MISIYDDFLIVKVLTTHAWIRIFWKDSRLSWDPAEWNGVENINLDATEVWIPDVVPYNGEQVKPHAIGFKDDMSKVDCFYFLQFLFLKMFNNVILPF